jgi:hypothetical protein
MDIDPRHGGDDTLRDLEGKHGPLPCTPETITGGHGRHIHFQYPPSAVIRNSVGKLGPGIDVRGNGGYVLWPPSMHASGREYAIDVEHDFQEIPFADAPDWLLERILDRADVSSSSQEDHTFPDGRRNSTLTSLAGTMRHRGMTYESIRAALLAENAARCRPPLSTMEVDSIAASVSRYQPGDISSDGEGPFQRLSHVFGLPISAVLKRGSRDASYELKLTDDRLIVLGPAADLLTFRKVQASVLDVTKHVIPYHAKKSWEDVVRVIGGCAELVDTTSPEEETAHFLFQFIESHSLARTDDNLFTKLRYMRAGSLAVLITGDRVTIRLPRFFEYLTSCGFRLTFREIGFRLSRLGFKPTRLQAREHDKTVCVRVWISPDGWYSVIRNEDL